MISLDTETTGLDLRHGAQPFLVTTCDEDGNQSWWEWDVDPLTRLPQIPPEDKEEIDAIMTGDDDELVMQNSKFDVRAWRTVSEDWDDESIWDRVLDTILSGHLLGSNLPKDLTSMATLYLRINIKPYEERIKRATNKARTIARSRYPTWRIAKKGLPEMPSAKESVWKFDMWLPRAIARRENYPPEHSWWSVCADYANADSAVTVSLMQRHLAMLEERGLIPLFEERLKILPIIYKMEERGVSLSSDRLDELYMEYSEESEELGQVCVNIAKEHGYDLKLPKSGVNNSLRNFCFPQNPMQPDINRPAYADKTNLALPVVQRTKGGSPSLNKTAIEQYESILPDRSLQLEFIRSLGDKRKRDTAITYMDSYIRFWIPVDVDPSTGAGWYKLHPSLNPTGSDTLRWSSSNPNEQNISKKEGFNLRYCFGPSPGREWWSLDAMNIELRIPAYEAGEEEMIDLFEHPDDPPYYGSNHLLMFDTIHPKMFGEYGAKVKKRFASTWYQWTKNGNFAVQYGSVEESGTADAAYHMPGAFRKIKNRFQKIHGPGGLNEQLIEYAEKYGYVETLPDLNVCPERGYPLLCTRNARGGIKPTVPLNYHVQGTAMWWMMKAMIRCQEYLDELNRRTREPEYFMIMQVHDELVFDFPRKPKKGNLPKIRHIQKLMEEGGNDIGVPTPVSIEYHPKNWSKGIAV